MRSLWSRWQIFRMLQLPNAMPYIFAGLEIAMIFALIGAIVASSSAPAWFSMLMQHEFHHGRCRQFSSCSFSRYWV
jgi:NitT/TauT family transport system permease protein